MVVGVAELTWSSQQVESLTFRGFEATTGATALYLALSLVISGVLNLVNVKLKIQPSARPSWNQRAADLLFSPLALVRAAASRLTTAWYAKRAGRQASLVRSPLQAAAIQARQWAAAVVALALKTAFVAALVYVGFKLIQGLMGFNWQIIWDNLDTLLIWRFPHGSENELFWGLGGLAYSILMAVIAISVSFFIGLAAGLGRASSNQLFRLPCMVYIEVIRGNPLIIVIFWVYFFIPIVTGAFFDVFWSATIALTIFTGAYLAEIVRSGVQNIPSGQVEAAYSTGLSYFQTMRRIILPQALKQMIPAIVGQFIAIFKDTSLAFVIGVLELTFVAQGLNNRLMVYPFEIYTTVAFLYFICCYAMSCYARRLEARLSPEKQSLVM
jgi:polar amino acid transport system permease protein